MKQPPISIELIPGDYAEEAVPFDAVMRHILQAKPKPRKAEKSKAKGKKTAAERKLKP